MVAFSEDAIGVGLHIHDLNFVGEKDIVIGGWDLWVDFVENGCAAMNIAQLLLEALVDGEEGVPHFYEFSASKLNGAVVFAGVRVDEASAEPAKADA